MQCADSKQYVAFLLSNHSRGDYVQKYDIEDELDSNIREKIFNLFLSLSNCRITSINQTKLYLCASVLD